MFLRLLLIFLIIYLVVKFIQSFTRPVQSSKSSRYTNRSDTRNEGDVTVTGKSGNPDKKISKDEGEYVDYEDV